MSISRLVVIFCPPVAVYKKPPDDQPGCIEEDCVHCGMGMWISKKKRAFRKEARVSSGDLWIGCYTCMEKMCKILDMREYNVVIL